MSASIRAGKYVLALDQGTTSSRAIVFDRSGKIVSVAQQEFPQIFPGPGHVEHDPEAIWSTQLADRPRRHQRAGITAADLAAIGVTNQRETTILWDKATGKPVANAIVWQSRVTAPICDRLKADGHEAVFRKKTGLVVDAYFSGTKIKHLLDSHRRLARSRREGRDSVRHRRHVSDLAAHRRQVPRHRRQQRQPHAAVQHPHARWDDELLKLLDVPRAMLPEVRSSSEVYGETEPSLFGAADSHCRRRRRSAGRALRTGVFRGRHREEHLRHRLLHVAEHGRQARAFGEGPAHHRRLEDWRTRPPTPGRLGLRRRRGGAMAARRIEGDRSVGRRRAADGGSARHRRRLPGAGIRRARRSLLGSARPRRHRGTHARTRRWPTSRVPRSMPWPTRRATCWK